MTKEIWKPIRGYTGFYEISNKGRVRSLDHATKGRNGVTRHIKSRILSLYQRLGKYYTVTLSKKGVIKTFHISTLLSRTFKTK